MSNYLPQCSLTVENNLHKLSANAFQLTWPLQEWFEKIFISTRFSPDRISPIVLTVSSKALAVPLTNLVNHCITIKAWPSLWKRSNVSSLYKKDSPTDKVNYRLVSVLTRFSKIFERVLHDQKKMTLQS